MAVVDIGATTTNLIVVRDLEVAHVAVIPIGGRQVTNDIAIGLKVDPQLAEFIKINHADINFDGRGTKTINKRRTESYHQSGHLGHGHPIAVRGDL